MEASVFSANFLVLYTRPMKSNGHIHLYLQLYSQYSFLYYPNEEMYPEFSLSGWQPIYSLCIWNL